MNLHQQGPGLQTERTIGMTIFAGTKGREGSLEESQAWWSEVREALGQLPGVTDVASSYTPPIGPQWRVVQWVERRADKADPVSFVDAAVGPNYFRLLGIPLIEGRHFDLRDQPDVPLVAIVSAEAARRFWPGESPIGKTIRRSEDPNARFQRRKTVIGVVGDVRTSGLQGGPEPVVYETQSQGRYGAAYWMVKSARDPDSLFPEIVERLHAIDPAVTIEEPGYQVLDDVVWDSAWQLNYTMVLLAGLAGLALLISAIGVYGVLSYAVRQRTREVGLRMAVGADRAQIVRMFLLQGLATGMVGVAAGLIVSAGLSPLVGSLLYGVEPPDSTTFAIVAVVMLSAVCLASYLPAAKAADLDPTEALRRE
jgi:putative ABC transport system permease protein